MTADDGASAARAKSGATRWLSPLEDQAWRAFRRVAVAVQTNTARDLAEHGLSEPDYEVLSTLSERPGWASSLGEQATKMGWSRSRLSHHATRMQARGLVRRDDDPSDGRGCVISLTEDGYARLSEVAPHHVQSVRLHFVDRLSEDDLEALIEIASRVLDRSDPDPST